MSSIVVAGDTSGSVTLQAPAVAGSTVLTLPAVSGTVITTGTTGQVIPSAALPAGSVLQVKNFQTGTLATGTTTIPFDNTIPQITEGTQFLSLAITPISATSKLLIHVSLFFSSSVATYTTVALFQDSTANALAANAMYVDNTSATGPLAAPFNYFMTSGTTSSTTFTVRAGGSAASTTTLNGSSGAQIFGGVASSSITITEIAA